MATIHSSEFQGLSVADRYFSLARGYLEGSRVLCEAIEKDDYAPRYSHSCVVLHLCRHAVELFLKGAIAYATNSQPLQTHHLGSLIAEYERVLSDPMFRFEVPFGVEASGTPNVFSDFADKHHKTLDQRYRYPTDRSGKPFSDPEGFVAPMFMSDLEGLAKAFLQVELKLKNVAP